MIFFRQVDTMIGQWSDNWQDNKKIWQVDIINWQDNKKIWQVDVIFRQVMAEIWHHREPLILKYIRIHKVDENMKKMCIGFVTIKYMCESKIIFLRYVWRVRTKNKGTKVHACQEIVCSVLWSKSVWFCVIHKIIEKIWFNTIPKLGKQIFTMNDYSDIQCIKYISCLERSGCLSICYHYSAYVQDW